MFRFLASSESSFSNCKTHIPGLAYLDVLLRYIVLHKVFVIGENPP
jgi:hypothetical protein